MGDLEVCGAEVEAGLTADARPGAAPLAQDSEEQVLGANRAAPQLRRLIPGEKQHPAGPFGIPFEHRPRA
jgi:hypothetical protein